MMHPATMARPVNSVASGVVVVRAVSAEGDARAWSVSGFMLVGLATTMVAAAPIALRFAAIEDGHKTALVANGARVRGIGGQGVVSDTVHALTDAVRWRHAAAERVASSYMSAFDRRGAASRVKRR